MSKPKQKPTKHVYMVNDDGKLYEASYYNSDGHTLWLEYQGDIWQTYVRYVKPLEPYAGIIKKHYLTKSKGY